MFYAELTKCPSSYWTGGKGGRVSVGSTFFSMPRTKMINVSLSDMFWTFFVVDDFALISNCFFHQFVYKRCAVST